MNGEPETRFLEETGFLAILAWAGTPVVGAGFSTRASFVNAMTEYI